MSLNQTLSQLENDQLIHRAREADVAYLFKHTLTQETAYGSLLRTKRRAIHRVIAEAYEEIFREHANDYAALLAQHYAEAGDDAKTFQYSLCAGDAAARVFANTEAIEHYRRAVDIAERGNATEPNARELYLKLGRTYEVSAQQEQAMNLYSAMEQRAKKNADRALELDALVAQATMCATHTKFYNPERADELSHQALKLARALDNREAESKILWNLLIQNIYSGARVADAIAYGLESVKIARELNHRERMAYALNDLFYAYLQTGEGDKALPLRAEALELWRELDNKPMLSDNLAGMALMSVARGDYARAMAYANEAIEIGETTGNGWAIAQGCTMRGLALSDQGLFFSALENFERGARAARESNAGGAIVANLCEAAHHYALLGKLERATNVIAEAVNETRAHLPNWTVWALAFSARIELANGNLAQAARTVEAECREPKQNYFQRLFPPAAAAIVFADIEISRAQKDFARVYAIVTEALPFLEGVGKNYIPDAFLAQARAQMEQNDLDSARASLDRAQTIAEELDVRRTLWEIFFAQSELARARGNSAQADSLRAEARARAQAIARELPDDYRATFLATPKVRRVFE